MQNKLLNEKQDKTENKTWNTAKLMSDAKFKTQSKFKEIACDYYGEVQIFDSVWCNVQLHAKFSCQNQNSYEEKGGTEEFYEFELCLLTN